MREWRLALCGLALLVGLGAWASARALAGDDQPSRGATSGRPGGLFGSSKISAAAADQAKEEERSGVFPSWGLVRPKKDAKGKSPEAEHEARERAEADRRKAQARAAAEARADAQAALLRRLAVCDQIRLIASQTQNEELMRRADDLDEKARVVYARRIARLPVSQVSAAAFPAAGMKGGPGSGMPIGSDDSAGAKGVKP